MNDNAASKDIYYDADANPDALKGKTIAILGFGSQGHAHALNLKDSGYHVIVGLREGSPSREQAEAAGFEVYDVAEAASRGDVVMIPAAGRAPGAGLERADPRRDRRGQPAHVRPRLHDPLR